MKNVHLISRKQQEKIVKTLNSANILTKMFRRQMDQFDSLIKSRFATQKSLTETQQIFDSLMQKYSSCAVANPTGHFHCNELHVNDLSD